MIEPNAEDGGGRYRSFAAFYPFYLTEHRNRASRRLHVVGTCLVIVALVAGVLVDGRFFIAAPLVGYGFAWVGHFVFEKNRPATFRYPLYSLAGDFRLWFEVVTGRRPF
ncbi:Mpo1-like protein [Caulobacter sp. LARHSG274]